MHHRVSLFNHSTNFYPPHSFTPCSPCGKEPPEPFMHAPSLISYACFQVSPHTSFLSLVASRLQLSSLNFYLLTLVSYFSLFQYVTQPSFQAFFHALPFSSSSTLSSPLSPPSFPPSHSSAPSSFLYSGSPASNTPQTRLKHL